MKAIFNPQNGWSFDQLTNTYHVSEKHLPFATQYDLTIPSVDKPGFEFNVSLSFSHSTGPEFDPSTRWIYKAQDGTTLEVHNDEKITKQLAKNYLEAKTQRQ